MTRLLLFLALCCSCLPVWGQALDLEPVVEPLQAEVERAMAEGQIPSMTLALVVGDSIVWRDGFGYANLWAQTPAVPETVYLIGSTFKAMSTIALMQQMERGLFALDDPVREYLTDFSIQNEDPNHPVTFRHLLTHTSGMPVDFGPVPVWSNTAPPKLDAYLESSLRVTGPPVEQVVYSNMAFSLVAHLVERFSDVPYRTYIQQHIFDPLNMTDTAFDPRPDMDERLAIPYVPNETTGELEATTRLKARVWPAGIVYGTVLDQANWLIANLNDGLFKGRSLIEARSLDQMHTRQFEQFAGSISGLWGTDEAGYGLTWWTDVRDGERFFAHSGSVPGYTAFLLGNRDRKLGVALLSNGHRAHPHLIALAEKALALLATHTTVPELVPVGQDGQP